MVLAKKTISEPGRERNEMRLLLNWLLSAISLLIVSQGGARILRARIHGGADRRRGDRAGECHAWVLLETHYLAPDSCDPGNLLVGHQRADVDVCLELLSPDFVVRGFWPAFWGAIVLALINMVLKSLAREAETRVRR